MSFSLHQLPHALATVLSLWIAVVVIRRRAVPGATEFSLAMLAVGFWSASNALEWGSLTLEGVLGWLRLQFVAIAAVPVLWFLFAVRFSGHQHWIEGRRAWLLWVMPVITVLLVWTYEFQGLMVGPVEYDASIPYSGIRHSYGPWLWVHSLYSYSLLVYGTVLLVGSLARAPRLYRWQIVTVCCAVAVPVAGNVAYTFGFSPVPGLDLTPPLFAVSCASIGWSMLRWRFLDLVPAARAAVIECLEDGVIVVDTLGRVIDANPAAQSIAGLAPGETLGKPLSALFPEQSGWIARLDGASTSTAELALLGVGQPGRYYEARVMPLRAASGRDSGKLVLLRDVTERRRADEEREGLIRQLQEASSNITTLTGLIPICAACKKVRDDQGFWRQVEEYVSAHTQAEFSHGLCPDCVAKLYADLDSRESLGAIRSSEGE